MRLVCGLLWPIPITLEYVRESIRAMQLDTHGQSMPRVDYVRGSRIVLVDFRNDAPLAILTGRH